MATFSYNSIDFDQCSTVSYDAVPVTDPSGVDIECTKVTITVLGTVNPLWLSTNKTMSGRGPGTDGDRAGLFLANTIRTLNEPRGTVTYTVGDDVVIQSPGEYENNGVTLRLPCDLRGGPFPSGVKVHEVIGDKSLVVSMTITTYLAQGDDDHILLSNRWSWTSTVDEQLMGTVLIRGRASFRKDILELLGNNPDDFRSAVVPKPDRGMRRKSVHVSVDEVACVLQYEVVDRAVNYGLQRFGIARMECQVSGGVVGGKPPSGGLSQMMKLGKAIATRDVVTTAAISLDILDGLLPKATLSVTARAYGEPGADRFNMFLACQQVALSRVGSSGLGLELGILFKPLVFQVAIDWSSDSAPVVQYQAEFLVDRLVGATVSMGLGIPTFMRWTDTTDNLDNLRQIINNPAVLFNGMQLGEMDFRAGPKGKDINAVQPLGADANDLAASDTPMAPTRAQRTGRAFAQSLLPAGSSGASALPSTPAQPNSAARPAVPPEAQIY